MCLGDMSTGRNDQPKRYTTNSVSREPMSGAGRVGRRNKKRICGLKLGSHPLDFRSGRCLFSQRPAGHDLGGEYTRFGSKRLLFYSRVTLADLRGDEGATNVEHGRRYAVRSEMERPTTAQQSKNGKTIWRRPEAGTATSCACV